LLEIHECFRRPQRGAEVFPRHHGSRALDEELKDLEGLRAEL
jgi:hypothetical protein